MLYIVATPIGNLQDITLRALDVLKRVHYILCEDTRHSAKLCTHYQIKTALKSFHIFNETERCQSIIDDLLQGFDIALISDAGSPLIADPGYGLIQQCRTNSIDITCIPGPCALIAALCISGCSTTPFQFVGFLPKKENELKAFIYDMLDYRGTTICYESPHRINNTLLQIASIDPDQKVVIARELTKQYETVISGKVSELINKEFLGEIVLLIETTGTKKEFSFSETLVRDCVQDLVNQGNSAKDAISFVSLNLNVGRKEVYRIWHSS